MSKPINLPQGSLDALALFTQIQASVDLYVKSAQEETSKREEIRAKRDIAVSHIEGQTEVLVTYLHLAHDSRADYFDKQFVALDKAMDRGEMNVVSHILAGITEVATTSPFADLKDVGDVRRIWADAETEFEI